MPYGSLARHSAITSWLHWTCQVAGKVCFVLDLAHIDSNLHLRLKIHTFRRDFLWHKVIFLKMNPIDIFVDVYFADKADFKQFKDANRVYGPTILFLFSVSITFVMLNVFITIICESFAQVNMSPPPSSTPSLSLPSSLPSSTPSPAESIRFACWVYSLQSSVSHLLRLVAVSLYHSPTHCILSTSLPLYYVELIIIHQLLALTDRLDYILNWNSPDYIQKCR